MMMPQEEEDLEDELKSLDIREDHGAEDSDVTPTNTPPATPPKLYIKKYPPNKIGFQELRDARSSRPDDCDSRTESSMSWGDDEFEGEATRQVSVLFDQLENFLYKEDTPPFSPIPHLGRGDAYTPFSLSSRSSLTLERDLENLSENEDQNLSRSSSVDFTPFSPSDKLFDIEELNESEIYESGIQLDNSSDIVETEEPSQELKDECSNWIQQFPHFRVRGRHLSLKRLQLIEKYFGEVTCEENAEEAEEVIAQDGDFYHLLPLVTLSSANSEKSSRSDDSKKERSSSRVCSGSNDPEVLKEQVLIMLFDRLWSSVTEVIEPVLHQYARYVIEQSVQYSSLSREPSTRGSRVGNQAPGRRVSEELVRTNTKYQHPSSAVQRPISRDERGRPISGIRRPSSAANRLQSVSSMPDIHREELQELLHVSSKPLQHHEDAVRNRTSSASQMRGMSVQSQFSQISLPSLPTPRTPSHRPLSSAATNHLLTPRRVDSSVNIGEQRPTSTSSYNARARFQERLHHVSRQGTIKEFKGDSLEMDNEEEHEVASSTWSRHIPFLPPIVDGSDVTAKVNSGHQSVRRNMMRRDSSTERPFSHVQEPQQQPPFMTGESAQPSTLSIRGTMLATHHSQRHHMSRKHVMVPGMRPVEPFLSWVMEHVDSSASSHNQDRKIVAKNAFVKEESKNSYMMRTKHFRRFSHH